MFYPKSYKQIKTYSDLIWDAEENSYKYDEILTHHCKEEAVDEYKAQQQAKLLAEQNRDTETTIKSIQEEITWIENAKLTK